MHDQDSETFECAQCGICCKIFGDSISPTIENVYHWLENDRFDILEHFSACLIDGSWKKCSGLQTSDLMDIVSIEATGSRYRLQGKLVPVFEKSFTGTLYLLYSSFKAGYV